MSELRQRLIAITLEWERMFSNAPSITTAVSEYDAAMLLGMTDDEYSGAMRGSTAVQRGHDFIYKGIRYQIKGTRPSGKPGSKVTRVPAALNYDWDKLIWVNYNPMYEVQEAWLWDVQAYRSSFSDMKRLSPSDMRRGLSLLA